MWSLTAGWKQKGYQSKACNRSQSLAVWVLSSLNTSIPTTLVSLSPIHSSDRLHVNGRASFLHQNQLFNRALYEPSREAPSPQHHVTVIPAAMKQTTLFSSRTPTTQGWEESSRKRDTVQSVRTSTATNTTSVPASSANYAVSPGLFWCGAQTHRRLTGWTDWSLPSSPLSAAWVGWIRSSNKAHRSELTGFIEVQWVQFPFKDRRLELTSRLTRGSLVVIPFAFVEKSPNSSWCHQWTTASRLLGQTSTQTFQQFPPFRAPASVCRTPWTVMFSPDHDTIQHHFDVLQTANAMLPTFIWCGAGPQPVWPTTFSISSLLGEGVCGIFLFEGSAPEVLPVFKSTCGQ